MPCRDLVLGVGSPASAWRAVFDWLPAGRPRTLEAKAFEPSSAVSLRKNGPRPRNGSVDPDGWGPSQPAKERSRLARRGKRGGTAVRKGRPRGQEDQHPQEPPMTYPQVSTDPNADDHA